MLTVRLPRSIEKRLEKLARRTGRTKTFYVREAIVQHLDEIEDIYLAEPRLERILNGKESTIPLEAIDAKIRRGIEQLERGEGIPEDQLDACLARLKAKYK